MSRGDNKRCIGVHRLQEILAVTKQYGASADLARFHGPTESSKDKYTRY
jgi:hypothetical protein